MPTYLENEGAGRIGEDLVHIYDTPSPDVRDHHRSGKDHTIRSKDVCPARKHDTSFLWSALEVERKRPQGSV